ncbi:MAG TPA: NADH-quinone oxidoreductase subunit N [Anaerolineales bacterium]|nr:NADH-quinone oxidoreductase subunit N [Anaerolineales bacterium]
MTLPLTAPPLINGLLPEISLLLLAGLVLLADLVARPRQTAGPRRRGLGYLTAGGLAAALIAVFVLGRPGEPTLLFGGMLRFDTASFAFAVVFLFAAAVTALLSVDVEGVGDRGEYYFLLLVATIGLCLMAAAADLILLYLAIETASIALYVLAGFLKRDDKSTESGLKYFLFGALTSAVMLYGFSLLFGATGQTNLYLLADQVRRGSASLLFVGGAAVLVFVGFAFKISAVPFHFWTPDVYEGAPTPATGFISTASKVAGFAVLLRFLLAFASPTSDTWLVVLTAMAVATMTLGNLLALVQTNIKRLLAYSSIAHAGYALIGVVTLSLFGTASTVFYLVAYVVTNLAAFAVVILFARSAGSDRIADYAGLSRRSPGLALALLVALLSLAGMPPLAGFVGKFYVFAAAVNSGLTWLAFIGVINAIIGLYYYMTVLKVVYLHRSPDEDKPIAVGLPYTIALGTCVGFILLIGVASAPWLERALAVAASLY